MTTLYVDGRAFGTDLWVEGGWIYLRSPYDPALLEEIRSLQRRRWDGERKVWRCAMTARNRFALRLLARDPTVTERYDEPLVPIESERPLWEAQRVATVPHLVQRRQCMLAADMRAGKTLSVIEAMERLTHVRRWFWVGPPKTLAAIRREFDRWDAGVRPVEWLSPDRLRLHRIGIDDPPDGLIVDESVAYKNPSAGQTQVALELRERMDEVHGDAACVFLLSGYPAPQDACDWWAQAELARPGFLREGSWWQLRERLAELADSDEGGHRHKVVAGWREDEVKLLGRRLEGLVLRIDRSACYTIPGTVHERIVVEPPEEMRRVAQALLSLAGSPGKAQRQLRELSDGFQYRTGMDGVRETLEGPTPKDDVVREQLGRFAAYRRLLFFAGYQASVDRVVRLCLEEGWSAIRLDGRGWRYTPADEQPIREASERTFLDLEGVPERVALVAHPGSGGAGLNFSTSPAAIFFSNDFNGSSRRQAVDRILGPVPTGTLVVDVLCLGTDARVLDRLEEKDGQVQLTLDELREALG